jgi:hypothetical protein
MVPTEEKTGTRILSMKSWKNGRSVVEERSDERVEVCPKTEGKRRCHERNERTMRIKKHKAVDRRWVRQWRDARGELRDEEGREGMDRPDAPEWMKYVWNRDALVLFEFELLRKGEGRR